MTIRVDRTQALTAEFVSYAYSAYGETVALGPDGGNSLQYTGRENDGTGLYYYRARYYDPLLKQWLSEDPIGIAGGLNLRQYVNGNPVSLNDPTGQIAPIVLVGAGVVAGAAIVAGAAAVGYGAVTLGESAYNLINTLQRSQQLAEEIAEAYDACVKCNDQAACRRYVDLMQEYSKLPGAATNAGGGLSNVPSGGPLPGQIGGAAGQLNRMR